MRRGFTTMELVVVISIMLILVSISLTTFTSVSDNQSLEKDVNYAIAMIEKARLQTVNAKNNSTFSVRFASSSLVLYQGSTYVAGSSTNSTFAFSPKVEIASINLTGGRTSIGFEQITGKANATGTIQFRLKNNQNASTTVILYKTGLVEIR